MAAQMTLRLVLTGPREGHTVKLGNHQFVDGVCTLTGSAAVVQGGVRSLSRYYKAFPEHSKELADARAAYAKIKESADGNRDLHPGKKRNPSDEVRPPVQPDGGGAPQAPADEGLRDAGAGGGDAGVVPQGDRHPDARRPGEIEPAHAERIRAALSKLDPENDDHWTSDGLAAVAAVAELAASNVTRLQIATVEPEFNRDAALEIKTAPPA